MSSFCHIIIAGHVGRDAEVRSLSSGTPVAKFAVAVNEKRGGQESVTWFDCSAFGKLAELCGEYVTKGRNVLVSGRIASRKYTAKDGTERTAWEVTADRVVFLSGGGGRGDDARTETPAYGTSPELPF